MNMKEDNIKVNVLAKINGGFGTVLVRANYIYCFYRYLAETQNCVSIDVIGHKSKEMNDAIFKGLECVSNYYPECEWSKRKSLDYDLVFSLDMYPRIESVNKERCEEFEKIKDLIEVWENFQNSQSAQLYYKNLRESKPYEMRKLMNNYKFVLNSADIDNLLEIGEEYDMPVSIFKNEKSVLESFGLLEKKYITIQRGVNPKLGTTESPKMWSQLNYELLIKMIKEEYPDYIIVQLGESTSHCKVLDGIDLSLVGRTDWDDLKVLLKHAVLHIDGECGMVHLRKAVNGGASVVLFGITPKDFFGYEGNINISGDGCSSFCCEINTGWEYRCLRGYDNAPCMESITPDMVLRQIEDYLNGNTQVLYRRNKDDLFKKNCDEIVSKYGDRLDDVWVSEWLYKQRVFYYELVEVKAANLKAHVYGMNGWYTINIVDSPAFSYVTEFNKKEYICNMQLRKQELEDNIHSTDRYDSLIESLDAQSSNNLMIVVDEENLIKDGQHRAAWWLKKFGSEATIPALKLYLHG